MRWREWKVASKTGWSVPRQEGSVPRGSLVLIPKHLGSPSAHGEPASFPQPLPLFGAQELRPCTVSKKLPW